MRSPFKYLLKAFEFVREYTTDLLVFMRYNGHSPMEDHDRRAFFQTIILSHAIEKGLSLREPRPLFGRDKINSILALLRTYNKEFSEFPVRMALGALSDYHAFSSLHTPYSDPTLDEIARYLDSELASRTERTGGVRYASVVGSDETVTPVAFLRSRVSCRTFAPDALPLAQIEEVIKIAQTAPSQCNRQSVRLHFYQDRARIEDLLRLQGGAGGFGETVGNLFVVTSEIAAWGGPQQRNQLYVDGGIYSMMLMLALHAKGILSCPLNLAVTNSLERDIKALGGIPSSQRLIVMIAVGKSSESIFKAARSPRCDVSDVVEYH
jgi:nitroreductase